MRSQIRPSVAVPLVIVDRRRKIISAILARVGDLTGRVRTGLRIRRRRVRWLRARVASSFCFDAGAASFLLCRIAGVASTSVLVRLRRVRRRVLVRRLRLRRVIRRRACFSLGSTRRLRSWQNAQRRIVVGRCGSGQVVRHRSPRSSPAEDHDTGRRADESHWRLDARPLERCDWIR